MAEVGLPVSKTALHSIEQGDPPRRITVNELIAFAEIFTNADVPELLKPIARPHVSGLESSSAWWMRSNSTRLRS